MNSKGGVVLVTGATGYIGRQLCGELLAQGCTVRGSARAISNGPWDEFVECDLSKSVPNGLLRNVDTIYHLAGKAHAVDEPQQLEQEYFSINTDATARLIDAAEQQKVRRFIFFSSVKALREDSKECLDESVRPQPVTAYGRSKLAAEKIVEDSALPHYVILRLSMVYGLGCKGNLPRLINIVQRGLLPAMPGVNNKRSMVAIESVIKAAIHVASAPNVHRQIFHLSDCEPYSINEILDLIYQSLERKKPRVVAPLWSLKFASFFGDLFSRITGRKQPLNSADLNKIIGSACYSSRKISDLTGLVFEQRLAQAIKTMVMQQ